MLDCFFFFLRRLECSYCSLSQVDEILVYSLVAVATCQFMDYFDEHVANKKNEVDNVCGHYGLARECHVVLACFRLLDQTDTVDS